MIHAIFGYTLMGAGVVRIIEISFVLKDKPTLSEDGTDPNSFQYLTPFLLTASGFLFMGATEEQMQLLDAQGIDHISYILILYSISFLMFLFTNMLIHLYAVGAEPAYIKLDAESGTGNGHVRLPNGQANGHLVRDAEEFELEGLTSDDEDVAGDTDPLVTKEGRRQN